jgi:general secretion pathway protein G
MEVALLYTSRNTRSIAGARRGFTLFEVLIVIFIVLALGGLVAYNLLGTKEAATADLAKIDLNTIKGGLKKFRFKHGRYPTDDEGIKVLWSKAEMQDEEEAKNWEAVLESPMPTDRWGQPWGYRQASEHGDEKTFDLWSNGPDKQEGTEDDIVSWTKEDEAGGGSGGGAGSGGASPTGTGG